MKYYARLSENGQSGQLLRDHLHNVATLCRQFAEEARPGDNNFIQTAEMAGWLHDLGKYRKEFQEMLHGRYPRNENTRHKGAGAAKAAEEKRLDIAFAIAGHHSGLPDREALRQMVLGQNGLELMQSLWSIAMCDTPELVRSLDKWPFDKDVIKLELQSRLLLSCLVDADWQDTNRYHRESNGLPSEENAPVFDSAKMLQMLMRYISDRSHSCRSRDLANIRNEILQLALVTAEEPVGIFQMTVPTGGGKTLSALAFALKHAINHNLRRIIYIAPYLSIIEQNAREIRRALQADRNSPVIFEHHCLSDIDDFSDETESELSDKIRIAENWDAPIIISSNVQFFESLFTHRTNACRKLHNIARSVVILDECQTLPPGLIKPTCSMLSGFAEMAKCSIVLCTATQPAWSQRPDLEEGLSNVREIMPASLQLFSRLRRVNVQWSNRDTKMALTELASVIKSHSSALCVVNTRSIARKVFQCLQNEGCDSSLHLSTRMCPEHRLKIIDEVRRRLQDGESCHLTSTQLIEAGVDVDFPFVYREIAPLEAIIQASGRCNREGLNINKDGSPGGNVFVFRCAESSYPPDRWYKAGIDIVEQDFLGTGHLPDIGKPEDIQEYFRRLYKSGELDHNNIQPEREKLNFASVSKLYHLIDQYTLPVVVATWDDAREEVEGLLHQIQKDPHRKYFRRLGRYQVNLQSYEIVKATGLLADGPCGLKIWWGPYDPHLGLILDETVDLPPI